ncbi:DUF2239 family protein [Erythrobacter mangrovi]|uniref:DUF2239 family protein n=1 Tax=Erythrobacter mangrovi TaxID=2739433 RepID=A0A7D4BF08_9SPHN|nr:DUF2239 family protein [Erythrobacter mangrovi]QKG70282.1 DUF2239 family protein [Erythrobacter mangrovi]
MTDRLSQPCTAFVGDCQLATGPLVEVVMAVMTRAGDGAQDPVLVFDDASGRVIDLDLRGTPADAIRRLADSEPVEARAATTQGKAQSRGRGRPKLGVVPREVTLLPRQWEWLAAQPGSVSQVLRKLVDEARRADRGQAQRSARERAYRFLAAKAGDLPGYEEAIRALFAGDGPGFAARMASWPEGVRDFALRLADPQEQETCHDA